MTITLTGTDVNGNPVTLTTTTDANGDYVFEGLVEGTYTVTETQPGGFADDTDVVGSEGGTLGNDVISEIALAAGVDGVDYDFIETAPALEPEPEPEPELGAVEGVVFRDANSDGQQASDDVVVPGVTVNLLDAAGNIVATAVTDASGAYTFSGLVPGDYTVELIPPAGEVLTIENIGDDVSDSDFSLSNNLVGVTVVANQVTQNIDAGLVVATPQTEATPPPVLALTGVSSGIAASVALFMIIAGFMTVHFTRRRTA